MFDKLSCAAISTEDVAAVYAPATSLFTVSYGSAWYEIEDTTVSKLDDIDELLKRSFDEWRIRGDKFRRFESADELYDYLDGQE